MVRKPTSRIESVARNKTFRKAARSPIVTEEHIETLAMCPSKDAFHAASDAYKVLSTNCDYRPIVVSLASQKSGSPDDIIWEMPPVPAQLVRIANTYLINRMVYEKQSAAEVDKQLKKIITAVAGAEKALEDAPPFLFDSIDMKINLRTKYFSRPDIDETPLNILCDLLNDVANICKEDLRQRSEGPGARKKRHVLEAAQELEQIWRRAGNKFIRKFLQANGHGGEREFVSRGVQFVWRVMSALDPDLQMNEIESALKALSRKLHD
jgi:hypothetical protein